MSKLFTCDRCGKEFTSPLDEEKYTDENGVSHTFDMCAPCRGELNVAREKTHKDFFKKMIK